MFRVLCSEFKRPSRKREREREKEREKSTQFGGRSINGPSKLEELFGHSMTFEVEFK